jgi:hypothetical protein
LWHLIFSLGSQWTWCGQEEVLASYESVGWM